MPKMLIKKSGASASNKSFTLKRLGRSEFKRIRKSFSKMIHNFKAYNISTGLL